ncbi:MAG: SH3-like domain-containing protein [Hyphomicrobiaceae bacterium]
MSQTTWPIGPRFGIGSPVTVADREAVGHCRSPWYLRGKHGVVVGIQGAFRDPAGLAYHTPGLPPRVLYKVRFRQPDLWPGYAGPSDDHLEADIYETWLEAAERLASSTGA